MIPLRIYRILFVLLLVSLTLAIVDEFLAWAGLSKSSAATLSGVFAGGLVFLIAFHGGRVLRFCGKGLVVDPLRTAKMVEALAPLGIGEAFRVSLVDSDRFIAVTVNEGGAHRCFISTKMVDTLSTGALSGVFAHEYGHVEQRHPLKQASLLGLVAAVKMSIGVPLGAVVAVLIAYLFMLREWEYVADRAAVSRAGPINVLAAFFQYQAASGEKNASALSELFSGHPSIHRRVAMIQRQCEVAQ